MALQTLRDTCALSLLICGVVMGSANPAAADSINVQWDPNSSPVGYRVHVGTQSGSYSQHFDVGTATAFTFSTATAGQRYCFAVSAYEMTSLLEGPNSAEACGYSNTPPTLTNPGNRTSTVGQSVTLQLVGSDPDGQPLTYSATNLPPGVSVQGSTGFISGAGTTAGNYSVTVRASDSVLTASQVFTWAMTAPAGDTTRPTASFSTPTSGASYSTTGASINIGGSAADNVGVMQVRWASDRGGNGMATGTTNWSVAGVPLVAGANVITVTATDAAGNAGTAALTVTMTVPTADTTRPSVSIATPTTASSYSTTSSTIGLGGSAADNVGVMQVRWVNDRGGSGVATGTTNWSAAGIGLLGGTNNITVTAVDAAGNQSTDVVAVTYTVPTVPPATTVVLKVDLRKSSRWRSARLSWTNAPWSRVDVYRNGMKITSTRNDGYYTDPIWGRGTYTYMICARGSTTTCSNTVTVYF
jgi:hypothetical protein